MRTENPFVPTPPALQHKVMTNLDVELRDLAPDPREEWQRMLRFVGLTANDKAAMSRSVEVLFRRGTELVVNTYDYLRSVPETAAILGWEDHVDEAHLEERRRFFTVWLGRALGMDTSDEFALYLFYAGKVHNGHGPRHIHTPPAYVTASIGLVLASFARFMSEAHLPAEVIAEAMAGWNKYLAVQLNQMSLGYRVAQELDRGDFPVQITLFGRLRPLLGIRETQVHVEDGATAAAVAEVAIGIGRSLEPILPASGANEASNATDRTGIFGSTQPAVPGTVYEPGADRELGPADVEDSSVPLGGCPQVVQPRTPGRKVRLAAGLLRAAGPLVRLVGVHFWQAEIAGAFRDEERFHKPVAWSGGGRRENNCRNGPFCVGELQHKKRPHVVPRASRHHAPIQTPPRLCPGQKPG